MFAFDDEQKMARDMVRRWVVAKLVPANAALERNEILPYDLMRDFLRSFGMTEGPESRQGPGENPVANDAALQALVAVELSRVNPGFYMAFAASIGLAGAAVMAKGTPAQQQRWGRPLSTMEKIGAWAMTEPGAGSDAFGSMRTVARPDGDDYVLDGQKTFITNGPYADVCIVYAKIDRGHGVPLSERPIHAFVVEKGAPGFSQPPPMKKMGMHSSPTGELFLEHVRVSKAQLLGEKEHETARDKAKDVFQNERTGASAMALGIIERCLEESIAYSKQRVTWGRPIADYQLIQEKIARMFVHKQNVENLLFKQIWLQKSGGAMTPAEASATKLYCARSATECALEAVQIHGGNGYMQEYHVEQLARDAKLLQIGGGTDEIQILNIARHLLKG
jgi:alkylation response protein AidB-like acyl-CoA dehydrogenase